MPPKKPFQPERNFTTLDDLKQEKKGKENKPLDLSRPTVHSSNTEKKLSLEPKKENPTQEELQQKRVKYHTQADRQNWMRKKYQESLRSGDEPTASLRQS